MTGQRYYPSVRFWVKLIGVLLDTPLREILGGRRYGHDEVIHLASPLEKRFADVGARF